VTPSIDYEARVRTAILSAVAGPWANLGRLERAVRAMARAKRRDGQSPERIIIRLKDLIRPAVLPLMATERRAWALHVLAAAVNAAVAGSFNGAGEAERASVAVPS
jgi:hypothetical protein